MKIQLPGQGELSSTEEKVLELIWRKGPIARNEIAELTGFNAATVSRASKTLMDAELIADRVRHDGSRGNPVRPLSINGSSGYAFGVSFSHRTLEVGLVDLAGNLVDSIQKSYDEATPQVIAEAARNGVSELLERKIAPRSRILGVGFAIPGEFSATPPFIVSHPYFPHLRNVDLGSIFAAESAFPAFIENDCNSAALGERLLGWGQEYRSFISVFICHGIGGGLILDRELFRGEHGNAGGLHALFPDDLPRPSGLDLFETLASAGHPVSDFPLFDAMTPAQQSIVDVWLERAGAQLREGLSVASRILDPAAIIIGGRLPTALLGRVAQIIDTADFCSNVAMPRPDVRASRLGPTAGVVGAAAVVFHRRFFDRPVMTVDAD
jgi:predicted NBD/HSP70 family sugar kinase